MTSPVRSIVHPSRQTVRMGREALRFAETVADLMPGVVYVLDCETKRSETINSRAVLQLLGYSDEALPRLVAYPLDLMHEGDRPGPCGVLPEAGFAKDPEGLRAGTLGRDPAVLTDRLLALATFPRAVLENVRPLPRGPHAHAETG